MIPDEVAAFLQQYMNKAAKAGAPQPIEDSVLGVALKLFTQRQTLSQWDRDALERRWHDLWGL
jgi:hypothetical protein